MLKSLFCYFLCLPILASSQSPVTRGFNMGSGFNSSGGYSVIVDSRGYVWASTEGAGVVRFDGKTFNRYRDKDGLCGNQVMCIYEDRDGRVWFGSQGYGVSFFDGKKFTTFKVADSVGLSSDNVSSFLHHSDGTMYLGMYNGGLLRFSNGQFQQLADSAHADMVVWKMIEDPQGAIWFSTSNSGLGRFFKSKFSFFGEESGIPQKISLDLTFDKNGDILLGSASGLFRIREGKVVKKYGKEDGMYDSESRNFIRSIYVRDNGDVFFGCFGNLWILRNDTCIKIRNNGNLGSTPTSFAEDKNGNVWMTTEGNGLVQLFSNGIDALAGGQSGKFFFAIKEFQGQLYATTSNALYKLVDGRFLQLGENYYADLHEATAIEGIGDDKFLIFSNVHGVIMAEEKDDYKLRQVSRATFYQHKRISDSLIIGTTTAGLYKFNLFTYELEELFTAKGKESEYGLFYSFETRDNGDYWIGRYEKGALIRWNGKDTLILDESNNLPEGAIVDLEFDNNGVLWFLNMSGRVGYIKENKAIWFALNLDATFGALCFDQNNHLYIGHSLGFSQIKLNGYHVSETNHFNKFDGIEELTTLYNRIVRLSDGRIAIAKQGEIMYLVHPDKLSVSTEKPLAYLHSVTGKDGVTLNSQWFAATKGFFQLPDGLKLPYSDNHITFEMNAVYYSQPDSVKYSYRLRGYDDNWSAPQTSSTVVFTNLPAGKYVFEFKAIGVRGFESDVQSFSFEVLTPWFQSVWFYVFSVAMLFLLVYLVIKWRLSKLRKDKIQLENTVSERTREIVIQKEIVEEKNKEILDSINYAKRIQTAILPPQKLVKSYLEDSFILYKPKDIVAGDFYWLEHVGNVILFASADCTGHGVPGALVSVVCHNALNRSVREFGLSDPGKILDKTREIVIAEFEKSEEDVKDGMDISLAALLPPLREDGGDKNPNLSPRPAFTLRWAGANNPLWIVRSKTGGSGLRSGDTINDIELIELRPDKQPIGKYADQKPFSTHEIELQKGDTIYIFTDGYQDQFGGEKGKKFKASNFKELVLSIQHLSMESQREKISEVFEEWKGAVEQIDDVCVIGVRV